MASRQQIYSILPELQELDKNIGPIMLQNNIDTLKSKYFEQLSNCSSLSELLLQNPTIVFNYIGTLESQIVSNNNPIYNSVNSSYISQKISILESAYSNLVQSSTQSSQ
jgi:hypothetical protein